MTSKKLRFALVSAGICAFAVWPGSPGAGNGTFDPLLDGGPLCGPQSGGQPPILRALILAKAETAPFQPVPAQPAMGEAPVLYENLGALTFKAGTSSRRAQVSRLRSGGAVAVFAVTFAGESLLGTQSAS